MLHESEKKKLYHKIKRKKEKKELDTVWMKQSILFPINPVYLTGFLNKDYHFLCKHYTSLNWDL